MREGGSTWWPRIVTTGPHVPGTVSRSNLQDVRDSILTRSVIASDALPLTQRKTSTTV